MHDRVCKDCEPAYGTTKVPHTLLLQSDAARSSRTSTRRNFVLCAWHERGSLCEEHWRPAVSVMLGTISDVHTESSTKQLMRIFKGVEEFPIPALTCEGALGTHTTSSIHVTVSPSCRAIKKRAWPLPHSLSVLHCRHTHSQC